MGGNVLENWYGSASDAYTQEHGTRANEESPLDGKRTSNVGKGRGQKIKFSWQTGRDPRRGAFREEESA